jgi:RNA polymerase sigma factor (sigma-70 family)
MIQPPPLIDALRRMAAPGSDDRPDAELLRRFVSTKDSAAFEALVRRYSGLVWGACRRQLRDVHIAEDAFQTTFLALARHAGTVKKPESLGAWLHRVAVRCTAALRTPREAMPALPSDALASSLSPAAAAEGRDLERAIDAEIDALPEPFRLAFVLCEIEERSAADAALALGCAVGTIESRLTRARERLRTRLTQRGITAGALAGLGLAAGAVPPAARAAAIAMGMGTAPVAAARVALADRLVRNAFAGTVLGVGLVGGVIIAGLSGLIWSAKHDETPPRPVTPSVVFAPADPEIPIVEAVRRDRANFPLPDEAIRRVGDPWLRHAGTPDRLAFSDNGRFLAAGAVGDRWLRVWDLLGGRPRAHLSLKPAEEPVALGLTPDGLLLRAVVRTSNGIHLREYDTFRGEEIHRRALPAGIRTAVFDAVASRVAVTTSQDVRLMNAASAIETWRSGVSEVERMEVAFVGDRLAVLAYGTDRVRLFDTATGANAGDLVEPNGKLTFSSVSTDGKTLAVWQSMTDRIRIWDVPSRQVVRTIDPPFAPVGLAVSPDGSQVAVFTKYRGADLYPARTAGESRRVHVMGGVAGRFSADGSILAVGSPFGAIQLMDAKTGLPRPSSVSEVKVPTPLAFHTDGGRLLLEGWMRWLDCPATGDGATRVIAPGAGPAERAVMSAPDRAALSPDRRTMVRCTAIDPDKGQFTLDILDAVTLNTCKSIPLDGIALRPTFAPDGKTVYAIVRRKLIGWDLVSGHEIMRGQESTGDILARLIVSADGRFLATANTVLTDAQRARSIRVWDAVTGECVVAAEAGHGRPYIAFSMDGKRFAAAAVPERAVPHTSEVRVWDLETRTVSATFPGYDGQPAFSPDGRTLAVTVKDRVVLLEFASGQARHTFQHDGEVAPALAWRPDGRVLAAASDEAPVYLWDVVGDRTAPIPAWEPHHDHRRWDALAGDDADLAFKTVRQLWAWPKESADFLRGRVDVTAEPHIATRACEALELPRTADGKELLNDWASGPSNAPRTREAKESLRRLTIGPTPTPMPMLDGGRG